MGTLPTLPHSSEFNENLVIMGYEEEVEKVRRALEIDHPLIRAFRRTWKNIAGEGGKEQKFLMYLQGLEGEESEDDHADGAGPSHPFPAAREIDWDDFRVLATPLKSRAVIPEETRGKEKVQISESSRGRYRPPSPNSRDYGGMPIHSGGFRTGREESSKGSRGISDERNRRRRHHSYTTETETDSSEEERRRRRRKRRRERRRHHSRSGSRRRGRSPSPIRGGQNPPAPPPAAAPPIRPSAQAAGAVVEELPTLKLDTFTWEPVEMDEIGLSQRVAKCVSRMFPDWVLWAELKGDAVKYQTLLNDIMAGFTNGNSISYRHIKSKIVGYLGDRRYRWKRKVRATWDVATSTYKKPPGMSELTFNRIVEELNAGEDTPAHRRIHMGDAASQARASGPKKVTNYWGQGGVKRFLAIYVSPLSNLE
jgi:hypothetical protein